MKMERKILEKPKTKDNIQREMIESNKCASIRLLSFLDWKGNSMNIIQFQENMSAFTATNSLKQVKP